MSRADVLVVYSRSPGGARGAELDVSEAAVAVADVCGVAAHAIEGRPEELLVLVRANPAAVVFNLVEAPMGRPDREAHVVALLEWAGVPCTGSGSETLALCRRKDRTRAALADAGVPVPRAGAAAPFPVIVKPAAEDGSAGIEADSVCADAAARDAAVARVVRRFGAAVVEELLPGRELNVALWGDEASVGEIHFRAGTQVLTWSSKWDPASADYASTPSEYPADLPAALRQATVEAARAAARAVGARGYLRVDLRLGADGAPRVIDVNPNPDLTPGAGFARALTAAGWSWERFVRLQVDAARGGEESTW